MVNAGLVYVAVNVTVSSSMDDSEMELEYLLTFGSAILPRSDSAADAETVQTPKEKIGRAHV